MPSEQEVLDNKPTTFREFMRYELVSRGMWCGDADQVIAACLDGDEPLRGIIDSHTEGYPLSMLAVISITICGEAKSWIAKNQPKAWYRPVFE